jgi:hypothetical protein
VLQGCQASHEGEISDRTSVEVDDVHRCRQCKAKELDLLRGIKKAKSREVQEIVEWQLRCRAEIEL